MYFFVLVEFKQTEFFTSYGDCFLTTKLYVPSVAFSIAGLDQTKFGFYQLQSFFVYCCHSNIDFTSNYIFTNFNP